MHLDYPTLLAVTAISKVVLAIALPFIMGRDVSRAARLVQAGLACQAVAWVVLLASLQVATPFLGSLAATANALALWALFSALGLWLGPRPGARLVPVLVAATPLGFALGFADYAFRVAWSNLLVTFLLLLCARATLLPAKPAALRWRLLLCACSLVVAFFTTARGISALALSPIPGLRDAHPLNVGATIAANLVLILSTVALLVAWRDEAEEQLRALATTDALTGVLNRHGLHLRTNALLAHVRRHGLRLTVLMYDLDHFKRINDAHGHEKGDLALRVFGKVLRDCLRGSDIAARLGGEEFCALLLHTQPDAGPVFDRRLRETLLHESERSLNFTLGVSTGMAELAPDTATLDDLLARADRALYQAKAAGRNRLAAA